LYKLLPPKTYPSMVSYDVGYDITFVLDNPEVVKEIAEGKDKGRFGVDEQLNAEDRESLIKRASEITGSSIALPEGRITRGEAVDFVVKEMLK
ncbi:MAG: hypothetical protein IJU07_06205, partial [Synergistaceae bacterium]|nr:hypothetical protein [Synergistaceae bacterium]